jgi:hypothetical protein
VLYTYKKFGASYDLNCTGQYPIVFSPTAPTGNRFRREWTVMNVGVSYKVLRNATLFLNLNNLEQEGPEQFTYVESRPRSLYIVPRSLKFGVTGQF